MALRSAWIGLRNGRFPSRTSYYLVGFASWIPVFAWFFDNVAEVCPIEGPSMYPFFNDSYDTSLARDYCLNYKRNAHHDLARGMIVTYRSPLDPNRTAVKRIIGLEGDIIRTRDPYPYPTVRIPEGHIWVEGDDGGRSLDSNSFGPIPKGLVTGRLTHILLPFRKAGRIKWEENQGRES